MCYTVIPRSPVIPSEAKESVCTVIVVAVIPSATPVIPSEAKEPSFASYATEESKSRAQNGGFYAREAGIQWVRAQNGPFYAPIIIPFATLVIQSTTTVIPSAITVIPSEAKESGIQ